MNRQDMLDAMLALYHALERYLRLHPGAIEDTIPGPHLVAMRNYSRALHRWLEAPEDHAAFEDMQEAAALVGALVRA